MSTSIDRKLVIKWHAGISFANTLSSLQQFQRSPNDKAGMTYVYGEWRFLTRVAPKAMINNIKLMMTMVAPAGRFNIKDTNIPRITEMSPVEAETRIVALKLLETCSAVTGGKISNAEISMMPTTFIASTTVRLMSRTRILFICSVLMPDVLADSSLNVVANRSS